MQELSYGFIGEFVKNAEPAFFEGNSDILGQMINQLTIGVDSMPRIKKASTEVFKDLHSKLGQDGFEALLKSAYRVEQTEESKEDLPYDDAKVQKILKLTSVGVKKPAAAAPVKKDFKAFLKQQKNQVDKEDEAIKEQ